VTDRCSGLYFQNQIGRNGTVSANWQSMQWTTRPETYQQMVNSSARSAADILEVIDAVSFGFWIS
jgi:hypothetical protein